MDILIAHWLAANAASWLIVGAHLTLLHLIVFISSTSTFFFYNLSKFRHLSLLPLLPVNRLVVMLWCNAPNVQHTQPTDLMMLETRQKPSDVDAHDAFCIIKHHRSLLSNFTCSFQAFRYLKESIFAISLSCLKQSETNIEMMANPFDSDWWKRKKGGADAGELILRPGTPQNRYEQLWITGEISFTAAD